MKTALIATAAIIAAPAAAMAQDFQPEHSTTTDAKPLHQDPTSPLTVNPTTSTEAGETVWVDGQEVVLVNPAEARAMGVNVDVVASAPVPDTPENRAMYTPLSRTGRMIEPKYDTESEYFAQNPSAREVASVN